MGVHSKSSNVGVLGETGRYPLFYQSIRLTLRYYQRVLELPQNTFVRAALNEQKKLKLPWFKNIQPLLKLDEIYQMDHVSAYHILSKPTIDNIQKDNNQSKSFLTEFSNLSKAIPLPSEKFRVQNVVSTLTNHFTKCWEHEKCNSSKLNFYHTHKTKFARETYLDAVRGFSRRFSTTKLRISSHNLEVEYGRYNKTPKEARICHWCKISMGANNIENENHFLFECDLYADLREKLITRLNHSSSSISTISNCSKNQKNNFKLNVDTHSLKSNFMKILSPNTVHDITEANTDQYNSHHKILTYNNRKVIYPEIESIINHRSYIINCLCTFVFHSLEKRNKFIKSTREHELIHNTIIINFSH